MHTKIKPIHDLLKQASKLLSQVTLEDVNPDDENPEYEDTLNDADGSITDAIDHLETIV